MLYFEIPSHFNHKANAIRMSQAKKSTALVTSSCSTFSVLCCHRTELPLQLYSALLQHLPLCPRAVVLAKVDAFGIAIYLPLQLLAQPSIYLMGANPPKSAYWENNRQLTSLERLVQESQHLWQRVYCVSNQDKRRNWITITNSNFVLL